MKKSEFFSRLSAKDKKRYIFDEARDYQILELVYKLEKLALPLEQRKVLKLVRSQLERDWRKPLLLFLKSLLKKYGRK